MKLRIDSRGRMAQRLVSMVARCTALAACTTFLATDAVEGSSLSKVVEEAKKPVQEQEAVTRPSTSGGGGGPGTESTTVVLVDRSYHDCYWGSLSPLPYLPVDPLPQQPMIYLPDTQYSAPSGSSFDGWHVGFNSLSPAYGGLENPTEIAVDGRIRAPLTPILGINGFVGLRFGHLKWDYANPIYAVDPYGNGEEIWNDSLNNISGYFGLGLRPFCVGPIDLGLDLGAGWRSYISKTSEEFTNDVFEAGWFSQIGANFALRF